MALIQTTAVGTGASSPVNIAFGASPTSGNIVIQGAYEAGAAGGGTAATHTNPLTLIDAYNSAGTNWQYVWQKTFGGTDDATYTITDAGSPSVIRTDVMEWSGLTTTLDGTVQHATTLSTTSQALGSITTSGANTVIFVYIGFSASNGGSFSLPGFTIVGNNARYVSAYQIVASSGTVVAPTASWFSACRPSAIMFGYKAAGGATPTGSFFPMF